MTEGVNTTSRIKAVSDKVIIKLDDVEDIKGGIIVTGDDAHGGILRKGKVLSIGPRNEDGIEVGDRVALYKGAAQVGIDGSKLDVNNNGGKIVIVDAGTILYKESE